jgi:hypothetical protein
MSVRSIVAVVVGYLVFGGSAVLLFRLSGQDPRVMPSVAFLVFSVVYGVAFAAAAGYVAAALAPWRRVEHAGFVAGLVAFAAIGSWLVEPRTASMWSQLSVLLLMTPATIIGGLLRARRSI